MLTREASSYADFEVHLRDMLSEIRVRGDVILAVLY